MSVNIHIRYPVLRIGLGKRKPADRVAWRALVSGEPGMAQSGSFRVTTEWDKEYEMV